MFLSLTALERSRSEHRGIWSRRYVTSNLFRKKLTLSVRYNLITLLPRVQVRCISGTPMSRARPGDPSPPCRLVWRRGCARRAASWRSRGPDVPDTLNCSLSVNTWAWRWGSKSTDGLVLSHLFVWISLSRNQLIISCNSRNIYIYLSGQHGCAPESDWRRSDERSGVCFQGSEPKQTPDTVRLHPLQTAQTAPLHPGTIMFVELMRENSCLLIHYLFVIALE